MIWIFVGLGGFCLGLVVGVAARDAVEIMKDEHQTHHAPKPRRFWHWLVENILLIALILVAGLQAGVGVMLITTRADVAEVSQCQASYNQAFSQAYRVRAIAAHRSREKLNRVFFTVFEAMRSNDPADDRRFRQALANYVHAEQQYREERRTNPYPPLPNEYCNRF